MKKVHWAKPGIKRTLTGGIGATSKYNSLGELMEKANKLRAEQQEAVAYVHKAMPAMSKLLEIRMTNGEPLTVMRPLQYQTSGFAKSEDHMDEIDRAFYNGGSNGKTEDPGKFVDKVVTINPGTQIVLKSLDMPMREFIFQDALGNEHSISFDDKVKLMTQTDVFETVKKLLANKGE